MHFCVVVSIVMDFSSNSWFLCRWLDCLRKHFIRYGRLAKDLSFRQQDPAWVKICGNSLMKEEKDRNKANASPSAQPIPIPLEGAADEGWKVGGTPRSRTGSSRSLSVVNVRFRKTHTRSYWVHPQLGQWQGWAAPCRGQQQQQCLPPADLLLEQILLWEPALTTPMLYLMFFFQILSWFGNGSSEPISFGWRTETGPGEWLSLIHIWRCRRSTLCRSRWSPYH